MPISPRRTVDEVLAGFDSEFSPFATSFAKGEYLLWLGSGISRGVVPGVPLMLEKMLEFLRQGIDFADPACRFRAALNEVLQVAGGSGGKWASVDLSLPVATWPDLGELIERLVDKYSDVLDVQVRGEEADYLVWTGLDVADTYGSATLLPDVEHLCVALLMLEGVVPSAPTTNWDGLIEQAMRRLVDEVDLVLSVKVRREDFTGPERQAELIKFHGCAVRAAADEAEYRSRLIARKSQISGWTARPENQLMKQRLEHLFAARPALIVGLSAQDANIHTVWQQAIQNLGRTWPASPPAVVFSEEGLTHHHRHVMRVEYGDSYAPNADAIDGSALLGSFAKPTLVALVLFTLSQKLCSLMEGLSELQLDPGETDLLCADIRDARDLLGRAANATSHDFLDTVILGIGFVMSVFRNGIPPDPSSGKYQPLTSAPIDRASVDPNFPGAALGRFAVAMAMLSRGLGSHWKVSVGTRARPEEGVILLTTHHVSRRVFLVKDERGLAELERTGVVDMGDSDTIVLEAATPARVATRSPRARLGRTGAGAAAVIDLEKLASSSVTADELFAMFKLEAAL